MDRDQLVMALASVFAGITVLVAVLGLVYQPFLIALSLPFGATAYFMWFQASGRLKSRSRRRVQRGDPRERERFGGFGAGARRENVRENYRRATASGARAGGTGRTDRAPSARSGPSRAEAYRTLGVDASATADEVKRAYRSKVKEVHPDTENGSEEAFKRVNQAYETLTD
ncbi:DnaJ domain-containing protein [Halogranum rubrum]|uniref:DnaJ domain-containing protein n=1 Tax=Halogranum rubrum TaxID=553466 RepID=A0A1I4BW15_9EURY|nr:J domain-containing protein [Halogranum rubrum]SFK73014.1 DnaJ domain-containing protein [Halogranum rubrum]